MLSDKKTEKSLGLVTKKENGFFIMGVKTPFNSLEDIAEKHFKSEIAEPEDKIEEEVVSEINGYPIKHKGACDFETKEVNGIKIETYKTKPGSKKVYAAGFFGVPFKSGMNIGAGWLFQTLIDNKFIGPYISEMDAQFAAKDYKGEANVG